MVLRFFRAFWFISLFFLLASLLYVYASLPEEVVVQQESLRVHSLSRDIFFYLVLLIVTLINALVYVIPAIVKRNDDFVSWFNGFIITLNIFFVFSLMVINVFNGTEKFDFSRVGLFVYGSLTLIVTWALGWPLYSLYKRISTKQPV